MTTTDDTTAGTRPRADVLVGGDWPRIDRLADLPFANLGQAPFEPAALERFVSEVRIATLAYARRDGRPGQVPIWYRYLDGALHLVTPADSAKAKALARAPRACVTIQDERPPYRAVVLDVVAEVVDHVPGDPVEGIEARYLGRIGGGVFRKLQQQAEPGPQVRIVLHPTAARGFDNTRALGPATVAFARLRPHLPLLRRWL
jgi:hypothetical protein